jgi:hypothetical protein
MDRFLADALALFRRDAPRAALGDEDARRRIATIRLSDVARTELLQALDQE